MDPRLSCLASPVAEASKLQGQNVIQSPGQGRPGDRPRLLARPVLVTESIRGPFMKTSGGIFSPFSA